MRNCTNWLVCFCTFGAFVMTISLFVPYWRVDHHGTTVLEGYYSFRGFPQKSYGLLHVKGNLQQSWSSYAIAACQFRDLGWVTALASSGYKMFAGNLEGCKGSQDCAIGFTGQMYARCEEYQSMMRISYVCLGFTFFAILMCIASTMIAWLSKRRKAGGISFGLYLVASIISSGGCAAWVVVTKNSFLKLQNTAWYPFPGLAVGAYMHIFGCCILCVSSCLFGWIVLPDVMSFDPAQEKIDKRNWKLRKKMERRQFMGREQGAAKNSPPPPGFNGFSPQPTPYGAGAPAVGAVGCQQGHWPAAHWEQQAGQQALHPQCDYTRQQVHYQWPAAQGGDDQPHGMQMPPAPPTGVQQRPQPLELE